MTENPPKPVAFDLVRNPDQQAPCVSPEFSATSSPPADTTSAQASWDAMKDWLGRALGLREGDTPFPWQNELLKRFATGTTERRLDIPTGLGKTAVMAIWLVARAAGAALPLRLVYVVDRRAVVDQATDVAEALRTCVENTPQLKRALGIENRLLPISTLRGQHVDNKEWLDNPALPAIIVGTVDMIGSRLLFEGYGISRKMRPYHAGLLGADTLLVLDEAHLVPPFERLLETIAEGAPVFGPREKPLREIVPPFKLLSLSATSRAAAGGSFGLGDADLKHPVVRRRLGAPKFLTIRPLDEQTTLDRALAEHAWKLSDDGRRALRIIVFCDKRAVARATKAAIETLAKNDKRRHAADIELFVGGRRVFERENAAAWLRTHGFIADLGVERVRPAFVVATSAGEVGVDLDADHMVSDLVAWERMVQRLGRVNRRGEREAQVIVMLEPPSTEVKKARAKARDERSARELMALADAQRKHAVCELVDRLPQKDGARDASPGALRTLKLSMSSDAEAGRLLEAATTPAPLSYGKSSCVGWGHRMPDPIAPRSSHPGSLVLLVFQDRIDLRTFVAIAVGLEPMNWRRLRCAHESGETGGVLKRILRQYGHPPDEQDAVVNPALRVPELMSKRWTTSGAV